jgi:hypothetical protein
VTAIGKKQKMIKIGRNLFSRREQIKDFRGREREVD